MCWTSLKKQGIPQPKTVEEDIIVYKVVTVNNRGIYSFFQNFAYKEQKDYCLGCELTVKDNVNDYYYVIINGFHSYDKKVKVSVNANFSVNVYSMDGAIYWNYVNHGIAIIECIVPKGSTYFENEDGEIVSNRIILTNRHLLAKEAYNQVINNPKSIKDPVFNGKCIHFCNLFEKAKN